MTSLSALSRVNVKVTGARGPIGVDLAGPLTPGQFLVSDGDRKIRGASGTGADAGLRADLAARGGAALAAYGGRGPAYVRSVQSLLADGLDVKKDFYTSAVGTPTGDSTASVTAAVKAMADLASYQQQYEARASLHFPIGVYRLTDSGVLSAANGSTDTFGGYLMHGEGEGSVIWLDCRGATEDRWLYDNAGQRRSFGNGYRDLTFAAGNDWRINATSSDLPGFVSDHGGLFKFTGQVSGPGGESAHTFWGCNYRFARNAIWIDGNDNADVIRVFGGNSQSCARFMMVNSRASYQNAIRDLYVQYGFGPLVEFGPNAVAASVSASGGQIVLAIEPSAVARWGVPVGVVSVQGGPIPQSNLCDFSDIRWELYGASKLFDCRYGGLFRFTGSARHTNTADKFMGTVGGSGVVVKLEDFASDDGGGGVSSFEINSPLGFTTESKLSITGESLFSPAALDAIAFNGSGGQVHVGTQVKGLLGATMAGTEPQIRAFAVDRTPNGYSSPQDRGAGLKTIRLDLGGAPDSAAGVVTQLPKGATIVAVRARIQANTGVNNPYRLMIANGDKSIVYARSTADGSPVNQNNPNGHVALAADILRNVGTDANARLIRLYADNGAGGAPPGGSGSAPIVAIVEYY